MARSSILVRLFGYRSLLIHGDPLVLDRWRWLARRLPPPGTLLDVGSGNGVFTIAAATLGHDAVGLTWNEDDQAVSVDRARLCGATSAAFEVQDVRSLDERQDLVSRFATVINLENIEHVLDDERLMRAIAGAMTEGGTLLLTTPNEAYRPINRADAGPFLPIEDGRHVRKGYSHERLTQLCASNGLEVVELSTCSGFLSQKLAGLLWAARGPTKVVAWVLILPLRVLPPLLDPLIRQITGWPDYSVCLVARKGRSRVQR
ncbi:MAG: class I SAM-dependent methyltransferase [Microthrixaceae bacterium]